jgi:hypothetical protein
MTCPTSQKTGRKVYLRARPRTRIGLSGRAGKAGPRLLGIGGGIAVDFTSSLGCRAYRTTLQRKKGALVGELGAICRYAYWSDRRIRSIAADNEIDLDRRLRLSLRSPALAMLPQAEVTKERRAVQRHEVARRIERAIGQLAVQDFVTPPPAAFAKGYSKITFAAYTRAYPPTKGERTGVIAHTRIVSSNGSRVEVCLFGSLENCADYLSGNDVQAPRWSSSSYWSIEDFMNNRGTKPAQVYDDPESIAVEILRVFNDEGMTGRYVFKSLAAGEWLAEIYHDVELDKTRWNLKPGRDIPEPVDRIVIGAPLWVRSK